ncbi:hypothetical protein PPERSA_04788 [Pseudocohnilembus persalinus]|uniref:Transmembrane protein n=1 Tax=Pseudocohnilembus persalinus TaxID=266149 RepID=A0A0V0Q9V4_PSEPJ|nr:hypothetical protein PPERSA_04788 [Pseudocohnilembus persalinus]|eukprot:KRW98855.1 hypothetical protein PPERSA_04788 [Pseudocohnilembus persalinus]
MRTRYSKIFEMKKNQPFHEFSIETKLFITNPFTIQSLKPNTRFVEKYQELYKQSYIQQQKKYKEKFSFAKVYYSTQISVFQHIYLIVVMTSNVLGSGILLILQNNNQYGMFIQPMLICGFIFYLPQIIVYLGLFVQAKEQISFKKKVWAFIKTIIFSPILAVIGLLLFFSPVKVDKLPFMPHLEESWLYNFFSTGYTLLIRQGFNTFWIWGCYKFIFLGIDYNESKYPGGVGIQNIIDPKSTIRIMFYIAFAAFIINTMQTLLYMYENLIHKFLVTKSKEQLQESIEQIQLLTRKLSKQLITSNQKEKPASSKQILDLRCIDCQQKYQLISLNQQRNQYNNQNDNDTGFKEQQEINISQQILVSQNLKRVQSMPNNKQQKNRQHGSMNTPSTVAQNQYSIQNSSSQINSYKYGLSQKYLENVKQRDEKENSVQIPKEDNNQGEYEQREVSFDMEILSSPRPQQKNQIIKSFSLKNNNNSFVIPNSQINIDIYKQQQQLYSERQQQTDRQQQTERAILFDYKQKHDHSFSSQK